MRHQSRRGAREGPRRPRARAAAAHRRSDGPRRPELLQGPRTHARRLRGNRGRVPDDCAARHGAPGRDDRTAVPARHRGGGAFARGAAAGGAQGDVLLGRRWIAGAQGAPAGRDAHVAAARARGCRRGSSAAGRCRGNVALCGDASRGPASRCARRARRELPQARRPAASRCGALRDRRGPVDSRRDGATPRLRCERHHRRRR